MVMFEPVVTKTFAKAITGIAFDGEEEWCWDKQDHQLIGLEEYTALKAVHSKRRTGGNRWHDCSRTMFSVKVLPPNHQFEVVLAFSPCLPFVCARVKLVDALYRISQALFTKKFQYMLCCRNFSHRIQTSEAEKWTSASNSEKERLSML